VPYKIRKPEELDGLMTKLLKIAAWPADLLRHYTQVAVFGGEHIATELPTIEQVVMKQYNWCVYGSCVWQSFRNPISCMVRLAQTVNRSPVHFLF
jgi:hypothetical protein